MQGRKVFALFHLQLTFIVIIITSKLSVLLLHEIMYFIYLLKFEGISLHKDMLPLYAKFVFLPFDEKRLS